jgi:hypothetical protein
MHSDFPIVLDACVLVNGRVCDLYLRLAEPPRLYCPFWSETILDEVHRTQTTKLKRPFSTEQADYWRREVTAAFPEAIIRGWEPLVAGMTNDPKDRHVLAAACKVRASIIVTFNLRDFPLASLEPLEIAAVRPQDYLLTLWEMHPTVVAAKLMAMARDQAIELEDLIIHLGKSVPRFSSRILADMGITDSKRRNS